MEASTQATSVQKIGSRTGISNQLVNHDLPRSGPEDLSGHERKIQSFTKLESLNTDSVRKDTSKKTQEVERRELRFDNLST